MSDTVPPRFRPILEEIVRRMSADDWEGLVADGLASHDVTGEELSHWVHEYPARLVPLPAEAWEHSEFGRVEVEPDTWWAVVPLWTKEEGKSDLSLEATLHERAGRVSVEIDNVHIL